MIPFPITVDITNKKEGSGLKILLVSEEPLIRKVLSDFMSDLGCSVTASASSSILDSPDNDEDYDAILYDIQEPRLRSLDTLSTLQRRMPAAEVILMSSEEVDFSRSELPFKVHSCLSKPLRLSDLEKVILSIPGSGNN